jgi:murein endopeptidase
MFLDYELQEVIYKWALKNGVSRRLLDTMFQYPRGMYAAQGIIRHDPGHDGHVHVRFKCPKGDTQCR